MEDYATIVGNIDFAQVALYLFWLFFFGLVIWIQRENMREGFPLESEVTGREAGAAPYGMPSPKTYKLPHGGGEIVRPDPAWEKSVQRENLAIKKTDAFSGAPYEPTGDALADGVGPASWAMRSDAPDITLHGDLKIVPLKSTNDFVYMNDKSDLTGYLVKGADGEIGGTVKDVWVDRSEQLIRYLEIDLGSDGTRLIPFTLCVVSWWGNVIKVHSLKSFQFAGVPQVKTPGQITMREEDQISAYWCGGKLYADANRLESQL
ncbi:MAG: photosynthetic reaction center subunit H [Pikeienuella sp.]